MQDDYSDLVLMGVKKGKSWPDRDVIETLPKIRANLALVEAPTGFESWMIIKKNSREIIGDIGFKGFNLAAENCDIGYGIIKEERNNGYAQEASNGLINWAFSNENVKEITAKCLLDNSNSIKLLKKLNFIAIKKDQEMLYWSLQKKQYEETK